jgi:hypothetical protein
MTQLAYAKSQLTMDFPEFPLYGPLGFPRTPDNKRWMPYTLTGDQVGALQALMGLVLNQARKIDELRYERKQLRDAQRIIDCSIASLDPDAQ